MSNWKIPLSDLNFGAEEATAVARVLASKWLSMGPEVEAFENEFASFIGVKHAFAVSNATAGLHLALLSLGIGPGDEVIQPALNFVAAANCTVAVGATPVFADIQSLDEPTIDPEEIRKQITPYTKAVIVMHYAGYLCRMAEIQQLCRENGLALIEDACHAIGAGYRDSARTGTELTMAGALGDVGAFSFFSNKNLATGEGGMVTTNRDDLADGIRRLRSHGMSTLTWDRERGHANSYDVTANGYNYRLDEIRAALGREQLRKLRPGNLVRKRCVTAYRRRLVNLPDCSAPFKRYGGDSAFHLMPIVLADCATRDTIVAHLREERIQTSLHYPAITEFTAFRNHSHARVPNSRLFSDRVVTLPLYSTLTQDNVNVVCDAIASVLATNATSL